MITSPADTLVCDSAQLAAFRSDAAYDYNRELITPEINIFEWIRGQFGELLGKIFGSRFAEEYSGLIMICLAILLLLLIVWFVYKKRPELFMRSHKNSLPYTVEEDTIYGVDFPKGIDEALSRRDYREAIRLLYLQTLKQLSDAERIDWQLYKTPTQYIYEVRLPAFRQMTNHFLRVRYGNFHAADAGCVAISAKQKGGANAVKVAIEKELSGLLERRQNRGMGGAKTQVMLCGIPNVGKSTFINTFAGSARAKAADRPGVTKGKQWVSTEKFDLLDMPGVLWKKFDSKTIASNLAFIGSIKDDILDVEELAMNLLDEVRRNYPDLVAQRYKLDAETLALPPYELLEAIGRKRGLLVRGGEVNTERCAIMLVDEFRACKWGRISLERPPQRDDLTDFAGKDEE